MRAREHFDTVWISSDRHGIDARYQGLGPNINIWWESPFDYSFGISYSIIFADEKEADATGQLGEKIEVRKVGLETKLFPWEGGILFTRFGVSGNEFISNGSLGVLSGRGAYLGLGIEFNLSGIGLAFEAAGRWLSFDRDTSVRTYSPSIGVHFYKFI